MLGCDRYSYIQPKLDAEEWPNAPWLVRLAIPYELSRMTELDDWDPSMRSLPIQFSRTDQSGVRVGLPCGLPRRGTLLRRAGERRLFSESRQAIFLSPWPCLVSTPEGSTTLAAGAAELAHRLVPRGGRVVGRPDFS